MLTVQGRGRRAMAMTREPHHHSRSFMLTLAIVGRSGSPTRTTHSTSLGLYYNAA